MIIPKSEFGEVNTDMNTKTIVIKVGSSLIVSSGYTIERERISHLLGQVSLLIGNGISVVLVISGAVACGKGVLSHVSESDAETKQMLAACGQAMLTSLFHTVAHAYDLRLSQFLFTKEDLCMASRRYDVQRILKKTMEKGNIPVINENDAISLNSFGGNDYLAQQIAQCVDADMVVMLTNVPGIMDVSTRIVIEKVEREQDISSFLVHERSHIGVGGMHTKVSAAKKLQKEGIPTVIADGKEEDILVRLCVYQESLGTRFVV